MGFLLDLSTVATGGESLLGRLPGVVGKAGQTVKDADPLRAVSHLAKPAGELAAAGIGAITRKGAEGIKEIAKSGLEGGSADTTAAANLRHPQIEAEPLLQRSRAALSSMWAERAKAYEVNMAATKQSQAQLNFADIDQTINQTHAIGQHKGRDISDIIGAGEEASCGGGQGRCRECSGGL